MLTSICVLSVVNSLSAGRKVITHEGCLSAALKSDEAQYCYGAHDKDASSVVVNHFSLALKLVVIQSTFELNIEGGM